MSLIGVAGEPFERWSRRVRVKRSILGYTVSLSSVKQGKRRFLDTQIYEGVVSALVLWYLQRGAGGRGKIAGLSGKTSGMKSDVRSSEMGTRGDERRVTWLEGWKS